MPHEDRAFQLDGEAGKICPRGIQGWKLAIQIRDNLFAELIECFDGKLFIGERFSHFRPEAEELPGQFVRRGSHLRHVARRPFSQFNFIVDGQIESGARAGNLVRQINGTMFSQKIFVPAHAAVRSGLITLRAEAAAVHHHERHVRVSAFGNLVLDVHLVDCDAARVDSGAQKSGGRSGERIRENGVTPDKKTSLFF